MDALKSSILLALLAAAAVAAPVDSETPISILSRSEDGPNPDGSYAWSFETANGIKAEEQGQPKKVDNAEDSSLAVQGSFSYKSEDGTPISLSYTADENGFQPRGDHLPVAPEIPPAILRALEWIAAHPEEDNLRK
ncbi:endocuticle structural glycoprotein SgAbd-1 [Cephus cinctus]|uniref:Endocuticle structural glycoprotein SgAbd-1 n=1 Tax=Cephus cinctus TaxID=211228 RepID=A0AAJ7BWU7_CEPCN|nr:endocuticle structural glycoprotein SgAbd-1 [Cephus cinctus]